MSGPLELIPGFPYRDDSGVLDSAGGGAVVVQVDAATAAEAIG